jgi:hypothetical protein
MKVISNFLIPVVSKSLKYILLMLFNLYIIKHMKQLVNFIIHTQYTNSMQNIKKSKIIKQLHKINLIKFILTNPL